MHKPNKISFPIAGGSNGGALGLNLTGLKRGEDEAGKPQDF